MVDAVAVGREAGAAAGFEEAGGFLDEGAAATGGEQGGSRPMVGAAGAGAGAGSDSGTGMDVDMAVAVEVRQTQIVVGESLVLFIYTDTAFVL